MPFINLDNAKLFFSDEGQGKTILLLHDGICHSDIWNDVVEILKNRYRLVRYDRRGYGRSDQPTAPYKEIDDLQSVVEHLDLKKIILIGSSAGGALATHYTLDHPDIVEKLILVGSIVTGMQLSDHMMQRDYQNMKPLIEEGSLEKTINNWANDRFITCPLSLHAREKLSNLLRAFPHDLTHTYEFGYWPKDPALPRLHEIHIPTLLIAGDCDMPDVHAHLGVIQVGIQGSHRVVISDTGHLPYLEKPELFCEIISGFIG